MTRHVWLLLALSLAACSSSRDGGPAGDGPGPGPGPGAGPGPGPGPSPTPTPAPCVVDAQCAAGLVCDVPTGTCIAGERCQADFNCPNFALCQGADVTCWCDASDPASAVCKRHSPACGPCAEARQCPEDHVCRALHEGEPTVCLASCEFTGCAAGFSCDLALLQCLPNSGSCGSVEACETNDDCPPAFYCRTTSGACVPRCTVDRRTGMSTNCAADQSCHQNGECGPPCATDAACARFGEGLECDETSGRCTVDGCVDSADCPAEHYCETASHACVPGCETEQDCRSGRVCEGNVCQDQTCVERGGVELACDLDQFCCGGNPDVDAMTRCAGAAPNGCYPMPATYCATCTGEQEGECGGPTFAQQHLCVELQDPATMESLGKSCGVGCRDAHDCPRGHRCQEIDTPDGKVKNCISQRCAQQAPQP